MPEQAEDVNNLEERITTVTFEQYIEKVYGQTLRGQQHARKTWNEKLQEHVVRPAIIDYFFADIKTSDDGEGNRIFKPSIVAVFDPPLVGRWKDTAAIALGLNDDKVLQIAPEDPRPYVYSVYNLTPEELKDPKVTTPLVKIEAKSLLVPESPQGAREINSWVADPSLRGHVNRYGESDTQMVRDYAALREAPNVKRSSPGFGHYTVEDIRNHKFPFSPEQMEFFEEYLKNLQEAQG